VFMSPIEQRFESPCFTAKGNAPVTLADGGGVGFLTRPGQKESRFLENFFARVKVDCPAAEMRISYAQVSLGSARLLACTF
jgi:hypothetical protein